MTDPVAAFVEHARSRGLAVTVTPVKPIEQWVQDAIVPREDADVPAEICKAVKRRSKYGNRKTEIGGMVFDSKREALRWLELLELERKGLISQLERQVRLPIFMAGLEPVCDYLADFTYIEDGEQVIEDAKGYKTAMYRLKKKLVRACYGIVIRET